MAPLRTVVSCLLLLVLGSLFACTGGEQKLRRESEIPELSRLAADCKKFERPPYPLRSDATIDSGLDVYFHEYGQEGQDRVIVAIHGLMSDHRAWRYVIGGLGKEFEVWAIDLPGCGLSDRPSPDDLSEDAYSPTWLARHVMSVLSKRIKRRESGVHLTLLCHSLGGGVALRMLGDLDIRRDYPDVLGCIDSAVLIAPLDFGSPTGDPMAGQAELIEKLEASLDTAQGLDRKEAAAAVYRESVKSDRIPLEEFDRVFGILIDAERKTAMNCMLQRALPRDADGNVIRDQADILTADYENVDAQCLFLWGKLDDTLPPSPGGAVSDEVQHGWVRVIGDCGTSVPVEQPGLCADLIRSSIENGIADWKKSEELWGRPTVSGEREGTRIAQWESVSRASEKPAQTAPSTVSVLSGRDVQRSGARYLSDSLRMLPGVEVQRISSTESGVAFRGFVDTSTAAQGTLGLVDGRQVYNQFLGNVLWDQLAVRLEDVERIEIIRGPASFIHGPNAMHGVVNIQTKSPLDYAEDSASVIAHAGSYNSVVVGTTLVRRTEDSGFRISAQWDDIGQFGSERDDTRNKAFVEAAFEVMFGEDPDHTLGLTGGYSDQDFDLLLPQVEAIPSTTMISTARELFAKADYRFGDPKELAFRAKFSWTGFDAETAPVQYYEAFELDLDTLDFDAQVVWNTGSHFLTGGAGFRNSTVDTTDQDVTDGRHSVNQLWLFAQDEWELDEAFSLTFGARIDLHSETGTSFSPRAAAVWQFARNQILRATAGRGFRNPSLRELWFDMEATDVPNVPVPIHISGNDDLDPESLTSFELGYFGSWGPLMDVEQGSILAVDPESESHQFEAGVSTFYNVIDNLISYEQIKNEPEVLPLNQNDEVAYGFELEGRYVFSDSFSALANYSYALRPDQETGDGNGLTPLQTANAGVAYSGHGLNAMLWANYYGPSDLDGLEIDSYILINGSVSYAFVQSTRTKGQVFVRFFNLLNDKHREHPQGDAYGAIFTGGLQFDW